MKPYTRGQFRAIKSERLGYLVQAGSLKGSTKNTAHLQDWLTIGRFDYAAKARQRVRNLDAACCSAGEIAYSLWLPDTARRYIKTGKLAKPMKFKP